MPIYTISGEQLQAAFNKSSIPATAAYNISGEKVFSIDAVKVMTYNVGQWYTGGGDNVPATKDPIYYALQNGMIDADDPDILFIQEYWTQFSKLPRTAISVLQQYFPYIHEQGGASGYYGRCICSKFPITDYTVRTFTGEANRYYDTCMVSLDGHPVTLVITHLSTVSEERIVQATELVSFLSTLDTFICAGDLNTIDCMDAQGADYAGIITRLLNAGFKLANCSSFGFKTTYFDENSNDPNVQGGWAGCLDNIVVSPDITILAAAVDETKLTDGIHDKTDHMPLVAMIEI